MTSLSDSRPVLRPEARLHLFGFEPTEAQVAVRPRSRAWRMGRTLRMVALTAVVAPLVGLIPPHAPWVLGAVAGGLFLARRRWQHRFSIEKMVGPCPRCGVRVTLPAGTRLRVPQPVPCESCHHQSTLELSGELPSDE